MVVLGEKRFGLGKVEFSVLVLLIVVVGVVACTLGRSSFENQKKPERARLGALGSLARFTFFLRVTVCCVSASTRRLSSSAIWLNHSFSRSVIVFHLKVIFIVIFIVIIAIAIVLHLEAHFLLNSWNCTTSSGCCRLCSSRHV